MTRRVATLAAMLVLGVVARAGAQPARVFTEVDIATGFSTEHAIGAAAGQLRLIGETRSRIRFNVETTWADRTRQEGDAFGSAYPYGGRAQLGEAFGERALRSRGQLVSVRAGQYRTPFGLSQRSDHAYTGFTRAPLIRYDGEGTTIANTLLERGADLLVGSPRFSVEASLGTPGDLGRFQRQGGLSATVRAQTYFRSIVLGASRMTSRPYTAEHGDGRLGFTGLDARWMYAGVQVRGEWLTGRPFDGSRTRGWYVDGSIHRPVMGPLTVIVRTERMHHAPPVASGIGHDAAVHHEWEGTRHTAGGRIRLPGGFTAQIALARQGGELAEYGAASALDVALTYSVRTR